MKNSLRYGIRKHKLGAASVFLGTMIVVGMGQDKEAAASEQNTTAVEENGNSTTDNKSSEQQTTTNNVNNIDGTQTYSTTSTEQPSNATQVTSEVAPKAVEAPQNVQTANVETVKEERIKEEAKPQVKETAKPQENNGDQKQVDLTPKKATQNQVAETQVEVAQPRAAESKPRVIRPADVMEAKDVSDVSEAKGADVTSKVTVEDESEIEAPKGNKVQPHEGQRVVLKYKLKFQDGLKTGDYFDFTLSNNVNTYGVSTTRKVPDIKNGSLVMAKGQVLENGKIRYTFTDYIKDKVNVIANLEINLFIDPKTVQNNGQQTITSKLNGKETSGTMQITYKDGVKNQYTNVNGSIETFDKEKNKFTHVAYIKPINGNYSDSVTVTGMLTQGSKENGTQPNVKIYEYIGTENGLPQSVYANIADTTQFKDVTNQMNGKLSVQNNGSYSLNFGKLDKTYVIHYTGDFLNGTSEVNFRTQLTGYPENRYKTYYYYNNGYKLTWDNGLVLYSNKANGDGKYGPIIDSNNFEFSEDMGNGSISGQYDAKQIIETEENQDNTPLDIDYHTAIDGEGGYVDGYIETIEETDSSILDIDYHTAVDSEAGHLEGYTESSEESNPIDFEESTHENSKHHADVVEYEEDTNPGGGQITTESNLVEFDEESTKGIVTGAISDHTTVEDTKEYTTESNLIELVDELPEEHGQAQGPIEEITENNHHISHSGLGTENGHGNYGIIEEIEENSHVDIKSELGYEGGQNSGNQSFEEDTEEDKPKYEQGGNIVDIDFDSVPQIQGQNKGDQSFEEDTEKDKPKYEQGGNIIDIDFDSVPQIQGQNNGNQSFEEDTEKDKPKYEQGGNIVDIDFDSVPHIHGFNKHNIIIEEDTNKDKPSYQFGGHNSVDFEEDTLPKVSGQNKGQQTIEEDTTPPIVPPTPPTPKVPSEPETPTPPTPEVPSEPETPTPPTPDVPSEPETPTPPTPEVPSEPGKPTPPTPEVPSEPGKPVPPAKEEPKKPSKPVEQGKIVTPVIKVNEKVKAVTPAKAQQPKQVDQKELPQTGSEESTNKGMLFGGLFSILGLALLRRNKKNNKA
ncbi:fibronectin-binding protein FnbA [Staphylococcus argenteus]|uniref:fibronectin-binding protein FnbA n=5 Tax=Staphylococcus argenteus TaxID=985002 RepID=UPI0009131743|nr:fibrinogen-binding adhesin SdrG C-terminal domain-containing protein [Staphylococcus argenteus]MCG9854806.1 fibrinogen-binding adhesin SdrG C-terminal domain-containing protein [Staphylococcus argenteus]MDR7649612.1 fibrinogen-binding adhesin SdrG C-terminal domain-containing protein [Staphylococcus argenteus]SGX65575.1 fibronectin-binding protein FnbA [Staphylococcus argenteus]SHD26331.1 fibronectin-binding protein FnbA [Staphylococcus argenteus]